MSTFREDDDPRLVAAVVILFVAALALFVAGCSHSKPAAAPGPRVWGLSGDAADSDLFCLITIVNPPPCKTVADVRQFLNSVHAEP